ncbi:MAG: AI-2E family transporter [Rubrobacteridae bacterium]|nr:AI-2E family transporter [Rubrobacteridae bacterium]
MLSEQNTAQHWWSSTARFFIITAGIIIVIAGLKAASTIIGPLLLAIFLALLTNPVLNWLRSKGLPGWLSYLTLAASIIIIGLAVILLISLSLNSLQANIPTYQENLSRYTESLKTFVADFGVDTTDFRLTDLFSPQSLASAIGAFLVYLVNQLSVVILALLLFIFLLAEARNFPAKAKKAFGENSPVVQRLGSFGGAVVTYTKVLTLANLFVGIVWGALLLVLGVDAAILWGFLAFILQYIPTIGLIIASVPAIIIALLGEGPTTAGIVLIGVLVINSISANVITPRYSAQQLELSPTIAFFSCLFWAWVFGAIGGVLSVVLTVGVKSLMEGYPESKGFAILLGPAPTAEIPAKPEDKEAAA